MEIKGAAIRPLKTEDLNAVIEIDKKVLGRERSQFWQDKLELLAKKSPLPSLVAEADGKVVGFILAEASGWEFGIPDTVGMIHTFGVEPSYQHKGIGSLMMREMISYLKKVGVESIYEPVNWRDFDMLKFLSKFGFGRGDLIYLELKL